MHHTQICECFNACFFATHHTRMIGGAAEPLYVPAAGDSPAQLMYREDFAASALHEAAHWCIAGERRRRQTDFGYHYTPPPRDDVQQQRFYRLESRNQALEQLFASAAGIPFRVSVDDVGASPAEMERLVRAQLPGVSVWVYGSPDPRARAFLAALQSARAGQASGGNHG